MVFKKGNIRVYFKPDSILRAICRNIRSADAIRACIAWVTHPKILDAMEETDTELIMTKAKCNRFKRHIKVKFLGKGRGKSKVLMHNKFLIGFKKGKPVFVLNGSANYTKSSARHMENLMVIRDSDIAEAFYEQFLQLKKL
jgi:phosphatidylserine/phosphatidylglycerophosphate/cardiolipin synthase-like enzyme